MTAPLARIERLLPELHALGSDGAWFADVLFRWNEDRSRGASLEAYLGLLPMVEGVDPVARRTELVKAMAGLYPDMKRSAQAKAIADAAKAGEQYEELVELSTLALQSSRARWPLRWRRIYALLQS